MKTYQYRGRLPSLFWPQYVSGSLFMAPAKTFISCDLMEYKQLLQTVFSKCTEMITTSLIPLDINLPDICAFYHWF